MHIKDLIVDKNGDNTISKGAVLLWLSFGALATHWFLYIKNMSATVKPIDAPESLMTVFMLLLGYTLYPKTEPLIRAFRQTKSGDIINNNVNNKV